MRNNMFLNTRFFVLVLIIVFTFWKVLECNKPAIIWPSQEEIVFKEGDSLEIICSSDTPIRFIYPNTTNAINISTPKTNKTEKKGIYVFQRPNTVFGDTGWYGCADYNVHIIPNSYDNPEVNWIYVYIKSSMHLFLGANHTVLSPIAGNDFAIPCKTTSPELVPILYKNNNEKMEIPFNPRIGFIMKNLTVEDSDLYECSIEIAGEILEKINYILNVQPKIREILSEPIIYKSSFRASREKDLHVNCTVQVDTSFMHNDLIMLYYIHKNEIFNWVTPQQSNKRIRTHYFWKDLDGKKFEVTCQLTILNVTNEDAGKYKCFITLPDFEINKETTTNITTHDIHRKYINLTSQYPIRVYQQGVGSNVEWLVFFDGYPKPHLQWKKYNLNITTEDNFFVNTTSTFTILKIKSLKLTDAGVYTLVAKNRYVTEKVNFILKVSDKPISQLYVRSYYAPNENAEFYCTALSLRTATFSNITWNFLKCLDFPSCNNSTIVQPIDVNVIREESFRFYKIFTSKVKMPIEMSGKITCKACNAVGCHISIETVLVSDGIGKFSIIGPKEPVIKGDDIEFTCVASVYYFTDNLRWEDLNNTLIVESDRLSIMQYKTSFTHRSTVKLNNVQKSDAMTYICVGESTSLDTIVNETYKLVVYDPVQPFFYKTNMNKTIAKDIKMFPGSHEIVTLQCFAKGTPTPIVTWYKDNIPLKENDQYSFKSDNQELNIIYLKQHNDGKYLCRATNRFGTNEIYQQIKIRNDFSIIGPKGLIIKSDNVKLTCIAFVSFYADELTWVNITKTEKLRIVQNNTLYAYRSTLEIDNVQESKNYTCAGEHIISNDSDTFSIEKEYRHYELVVHDPVLPFFYKSNMDKTKAKVIKMFQESHKNVNATLQCFAKGMPMPSVTWYKDHIEQRYTILKEDNQYSFKSDNQELNIKYLKQNDSGTYYCVAINRFGTNITYQEIRIKVQLPEIKHNFCNCTDNSVKNFYINGPKEVLKGADVKLTCVASIFFYSNELTWINFNKTENTHIVQSDTPFTYQSTLEIYNIQESNAENYTCAGECIISNDSSTFFIMKNIRHELIVHEPVPPFFNNTNMNQTKVKDIDMNTDGYNTLILKCFVNGMPKPNIIWFKDNTTLKEDNQYSFKFDNQELNIKYFKQNDSGKYICRANNEFGEKEIYQQISLKNMKSVEPKSVEQKSVEQKPDAMPIILGIISVILGIFITITILLQVRREKKLKRELMKTGLMHFVDGAVECLKSDLTVDNQAELLPYDKKWEFPRERLKLGKELGSGAFGVVMEAEAYGIRKNEIVTTVAVKMVRRTTDLTYVRALASELKIMVHLGKHLNVVNLLGACTKNISKRKLLVIVEYCCFGNLHNYLLKHRINFINQIDSKTGKIAHNIGMDTLTKITSVNTNNSLNISSDIASYKCSKTTNTNCEETSCSTDGYIFNDKLSQSYWSSNYDDCNDQNLKSICTQDLLSWAFQVARGMEYLSQRRVLHGDLAARNILLSEDNVVKICDFGLAKSMYKDGDYQKKGAGPLPIRWIAIESMKDRIFSTQSDIWSFGIMLWEFFTLAETPYPGIDDERLYPKLIEGYRMEQPKYANREIYDIMLQCWKAEPISRPSFTNLVQSIGNLIEESVKSHYINLNMPYVNTNTMFLESGKTDYLTMMCVPDHAILSSARQDYVKSEQIVSEDASNSCMSVDSHTDKSLIFNPRPHQDHSELLSFTSDLQGTLKSLPAKQTDESKSIVQVSAEQIDSKNNDFVSIIHMPDNQYVETKKRSEEEYAG